MTDHVNAIIGVLSDGEVVVTLEFEDGRLFTDTFISDVDAMEDMLYSKYDDISVTVIPDCTITENNTTLNDMENCF